MNKAVKNSFINLWRNRVSTIATIIVIAILVFILNIIVVVHMTAENELQKLSKKIDLIVYLEKNIDQKTAEEIIQTVQEYKEVESATFISQEKALEDFLAAHPKTAEFYQKFQLSNTLPPSIRIVVKNPGDYQKIFEKLKTTQYKNLITNLNEERRDMAITGNIIRNLEDLTKFTRYLLAWIMIAFALGAVLMVYNAIHLNIYTRKMEISIMRLVGAGDGFIQLPYLLEALWISLIALTLSFLLFWTLNETTILNELAVFGKNIKIPYGKIFILETAVIILLHLGSSFLAVQRHIKNHLIAT